MTHLNWCASNFGSECNCKLAQLPENEQMEVINSLFMLNDQIRLKNEIKCVTSSEEKE